jgi:hypothetical protein
MIEAVIYMGLLALLAVHPGMRRLARDIPGGYRLASASLIILLVAGQLANEGEAMFPFVQWQMYTRQAPSDPVVLEYTGVTRAGEDQPLNVLGVASSVGLRWPLSISISRYHRAQVASERAAHAEDCRDRLRVIAGLYNQRFAGEPIETLRVWQRRIPIVDYQGPESITREILWEIPIARESGDPVDG